MPARRGLLLLLGLGVCLLATPADAVIPDLIRPTAREGTISLPPDPTVLNSRRVEFDRARMESADNKNFRFVLFGGIEILLVKDRDERRGNAFLWVGHVAGDPGSVVVFASVGNAVSGNIVTRRMHRRVATYTIRDLGNRVWALRRIAQFRFPRDGAPAVPEIPPPPQADEEPCPSDTGETIDLLVAYTDDVVAGAPSANAVEADIHVAVELANVTLAQSGITPRLRIVRLLKVDYTESRNGTTDRDRLQDPDDDKLDNLHDLRDSVAADIVLLIVKRLDRICGMANLMEPISAGFAPLAFAVVRESCAADNFTVAHEIGHLMGARHDRFNDGITQTTGFNFGHVERTPSPPGTPWYTIMATFRECDKAPAVECDRIPFWSNPELKTDATMGGDTLGTDREDNRRQLNDAARTVAKFRCSAARVP